MEFQKTVAFNTLGCKLNFSETETIAQLFDQHGYKRESFKKLADVYVINTCSVTETANSKSRYAIRSALKINPEARIVVVGCYAQLKPDEIANIEGVDLVLGTNEKFKIIERLTELEQTGIAKRIYSCEIEEVEQYNPSYSLGSRTRSFLKVQDGCDYKCSYCTIPMARGKSRNPQISQLVEQAHIIAQNGIKEIVLTGINIGDFGKSTGDNFLRLIEAFEQVEGIKRYRISSIEPNLITTEIIEHIAQSRKFMPHFHIPLQAGSNSVLKYMRRRYDTKLFANKIYEISQKIPNAGIGIDVIVGTPGETNDLFEETVLFIESLPVSYLHVFTYSPRDNTDALLIEPKVNEKIKKERSNRLHKLSENKQSVFAKNQVGKVMNVLLESKTDTVLMSGFTENYLKVSLPYNQKEINTIRLVKILSVNDEGEAIGGYIS
ncbi:MAG: tRNA (N(6)-L-threonylcarbamoyladenosine(37)-C(2))-methylthiotransferase MtaB [Bacteroidales bacterium]|nr:tRNA (N(6)-L-threonylcarbamoyladenosine(37)-C(2))-methylthiotransferase MtaB [Bacteroidales bacterium]